MFKFIKTMFNAFMGLLVVLFILPIDTMYCMIVTKGPVRGPYRYAVMVTKLDNVEKYFFISLASAAGFMIDRPIHPAETLRGMSYKKYIKRIKTGEYIND